MQSKNEPNDILFVSESDILPELEIAQSEISHYGYSLSFPIHMSKALDYLKATTHSTVLINAHNKKIEAYELCKEIKNTFRGAIKSFVFLPDSNPNEGSKFGLVNAEVEDECSIKNIVDKLPKKNKRDYLLDENVISVYGMHGGAGCSFIAILLSYVLSQNKQSTLLLESTNTRAIQRYLNLDANIPLLTRDRSKEIDQAKDLDWFKGFISKSPLIEKMHYLNLFATAKDKSDYHEQASKNLRNLAFDINSILEENKEFAKTPEEINKHFFALSNSLQLMAKELEGETFTLFNEIVQLGSKLSQNIIFDIAGDVYSPLNKQLLKLSNSLVMIFRDAANLKAEFQTQKDFFESNYDLRVIPVIAPAHYHYSNYQALTNQDWHDLLGDAPLIYPYDPESVIRFTLDAKGLAKNSALYKFAEKLLHRLAIPIKKQNQRNSLLSFLTKDKKELV